MPIKEIAKQSGYENVQSFTRIFSSVYGMPPATYREKGSHTQFLTESPNQMEQPYEVEIREITELPTVSVQHEGSYMEIGRGFDTLFTRLGAAGLLEGSMRMIAIFYSDPSAVPETELKSRACLHLGKDIPPLEPLEQTTVFGGTYAVLRHKGPYADMRAAYQWLFGQWLLQSGRELEDSPAVEEYLNSPQDTAPTGLLTDIYLPLKR